MTLDHVGAIARDLDAAALRWQRLGFTLSPVSRQRGAVPGREGMHPWASANRCAIFRQGYLELVGLVDATAFNPWQRFIERFEGLHLAAMRCENADVAYARLSPAAPFLDPPIARERKLVYRGEERTMRFRNIFSRDTECPEGRYIVIEHQTPELLWQPELLDHENGALGLREMIVAADDPAVERRARALDAIAQVVSTAEFERRFGQRPNAPCFAAITVEFADLARAAALFAARGIPVERRGDERWLAPEHTNGFVMRLIENAARQEGELR